ncbi:MAG: hypothetical protein V5A88_09565 [Candidatus Thermoplasmatota archaeon]
MELECQSCGYEWDYQGESDYYATCPNCQYKVKIPAQAEVVSEKKEKGGREVEIPAQAKVVTPDEESTRFDEKEETFLQELERCEDTEQAKEVCKKYDQEEFNALKKKIKDKAARMRKDLKAYEQVEETLEKADWEYSD